MPPVHSKQYCGFHLTMNPFVTKRNCVSPLLSALQSHPCHTPLHFSLATRVSSSTPGTLLPASFYFWHILYIYLFAGYVRPLQLLEHFTPQPLSLAHLSWYLIKVCWMDRLMDWWADRWMDGKKNCAVSSWWRNKSVVPIIGLLKYYLHHRWHIYELICPTITVTCHIYKWQPFKIVLISDVIAIFVGVSTFYDVCTKLKSPHNSFLRM